MRFNFILPDEELDLAVEYYERCQSGLCLEFVEEVYATIARIIDYPGRIVPDDRMEDSKQ